MIKKLTQKQQTAVDHYRINGDKTAAYKSAYNCKNMTTRTVHRRAIELFDNKNVRACMQHVRKKQSQKLDISENRVLAELAAIGFSNAACLFDESGSPLLISKMDVATQRSIKAVTVKRYIERTSENQFEEVEIQKIELHPKLPALVKIAEIKGLAQAADKNISRPVEVTVNINGQSASIENAD